jgi:hypothetical protein
LKLGMTTLTRPDETGPVRNGCAAMDENEGLADRNHQTTRRSRAVSERAANMSGNVSPGNKKN